MSLPSSGYKPPGSHFARDDLPPPASAPSIISPSKTSGTSLPQFAFSLTQRPSIEQILRAQSVNGSNRNITMSRPQVALVAALVATESQVPVVSHETILEIEAKARETYKISINLCKITSVLNLKDFGKPIEVVKRINEFALRSSDIAVCGESCVSEDESIRVLFLLNHQQRLDDVFFRAVALMEAETVEGLDQRVRAANAVRQARIETRAEYEVWKAVKVAEREKRGMKTHMKVESLKN